MNARSQRARLAKWWVASLLVVIIVEAAVCAALFVPQARLMGQLRGQKRYVEEQFGRLRQAPESFQQAVSQVNQTGELLARLNPVTDRPVQDIVLEAVSAANAAGDVEVVSLSPEQPPVEKKKIKPRSSEAKSKEQAVEETVQAPPPAWRLRCKGTFRDLTLFLNRLETQGLLMEAGDFRLDATERDAVEAEVVLKSWSSSAARLEASEPAAEVK